MLDLSEHKDTYGIDREGLSSIKHESAAATRAASPLLSVLFGSIE